MAKILMFNKFDLNINYINYINMSRNYISKQLLTSSINIPTDRLRGDINETILRQIKKRFEGTCNQDGFIEKDSIEITNRSLGELKTINNKSYIVYNLTYQANVISPSKGDKLSCVVNAISKVGAICYIKEKEHDTINDSPFVIMVPREFFSQEDDVDALSPGSKLNVIVEAARVKYRSESIQLVARPE